MTYIPTFPGEHINQQWLYDELQRIAVAIQQPMDHQYDVLHVAPDRPQEGLVVFADGTDWNPTGAGGGLHQYIGGVWDKL